MKKLYLKKGLAIGIIFLFLVVAFSPNISSLKQKQNVIDIIDTLSYERPTQEKIDDLDNEMKSFISYENKKFLCSLMPPESPTYGV